MQDHGAIRFSKSFDGVQIASMECGSGPPVIKAATWLTHLGQRPAGTIHAALIDEFSRAGRYIEYDTRGWGLSQRRVDDISFEAWVRDLETVADAHGHERLTLLGFSSAAGVAVEYASRHPERVSHLILYGGYATSYHSASNPDPAIRREGNLMVELAEVGWGSPSSFFRQVFVSRFMPDATAQQWSAFDQLMRETATADVAARQLRAMYAMNVKSSAAQVRCRTLVMHSQHDQMVDFKQGQRLASLIPGARFVPLPGRNHILFPDEPAWKGFTREVADFLGREPARAMSAPESAPRLTRRQQQVLRLVARGHSDKEVAIALNLSPRTVEMHVSGALRALGCRTRAEATHQAARQQLLDA